MSSNCWGLKTNHEHAVMATKKVQRGTYKLYQFYHEARASIASLYRTLLEQKDYSLPWDEKREGDLGPMHSRTGGGSVPGPTRAS